MVEAVRFPGLLEADRLHIITDPTPYLPSNGEVLLFTLKPSFRLFLENFFFFFGAQFLK